MHNLIGTHIHQVSSGSERIYMTLMREDLETLDSLNWLNDQVNEKIEDAHQFVYNSMCFNWFYRSSTSTST